MIKCAKYSNTEACLMAKVYLSVSSNSQAQKNISSALVLLQRSYGVLNVSSVYRNQPLHKIGEYYLNLVLCFDTQLSILALIDELKMIENGLGRNRERLAIPVVSIDLDLLKYETADESIEICSEITSRSFLLSPLSEIAGHEIDKKSGLCYAALWEMHDKDIHPLEKVALSL